MVFVLEGISQESKLVVIMSSKKRQQKFTWYGIQQQRILIG